MAIPASALVAILVHCGTKGDGGTTPMPTPNISGGSTDGSISESVAKTLDPALFGEWHDLSNPTAGVSSKHGIETWVLGKIDQKFVLEKKRFDASVHARYLVQTNTTVTPHQLTLTVTSDYFGTNATGAIQKCVYGLSVITTESLTGDALTLYKSLISLPRRTLKVSCSAFGATDFPGAVDSKAQELHNIDDGFNDLKKDSFSSGESSSLEIPFDPSNADRRVRTWDSTATFADLRVIIDYTGTVAPAGTQIYLIHPDGSKLLVHDKLAMESGKYFRTVGEGGFPLDTSSWVGKPYGDFSLYKLRLIGYSATDVKLFRVGIYPTAK